MARIDVNWQAVGVSLCTGASGLVIGAYLLVHAFGYLSPLRAERLAAAASERAVVAALAPGCAEDFRSLPDATERMVALMTGRSLRDAQDVFPAELVTRPGERRVDDKLIRACRAILLHDASDRQDITAFSAGR